MSQIKFAFQTDIPQHETQLAYIPIVVKQTCTESILNVLNEEQITSKLEARKSLKTT